MKNLLKMVVFAAMSFGFASANADDLFVASNVTASHSIRDLAVVNFFAPNQPVVMARGEAADETRVFTFYQPDSEGTLKPKPVARVVMPESSLFFDLASLKAVGHESLLFFDDEGVLVYDIKSRKLDRVVKTPSIYRQKGTPLFEQVDFARDFTGDGLADILVPDFHGYHLFINDGTGQFSTAIELDMEVELRLASAADQYGQTAPYSATPRYSQFPVYSLDANFDGLPDIAFLKDRAFMVFHQKASGGFATSVVEYSLDIAVIGNSFAEQLKSRERYADQSNLRETIIKTVLDINGDGTADIMTETDRAEGLFNRSTTYEFHYGYEMGGNLAFRVAPNASITLDGIAVDTRQIDFAADGRIDFAGAALNIGIGKVIGILLSGSTSIAVQFYEQGEDGIFAENADYRKKISVDFDLSSGRSSTPVVEMADVNGDGFKDLILSDKQTALEIFIATPEGKKMFERKPQSIPQALPKNGEMVTFKDVNGDGKADILLHYDRLGADGQENKTRFTVMITR